MQIKCLSNMCSRSRLATVLILLSFGSTAQPLPKLIPYVDKGRWGYCDTNGVVKIRPKWDEADFFAHGKARVEIEHPNKTNFQDFSYCIINEQGKYIIPPYRRWTGKWGPSLKSANFNARNKAGRWGIIDTNNREVIPCMYDAPKGGDEFTSSKGWSPYFKVAGRNGKVGLIDTSNRVIIPFEYDGFAGIVTEGGDRPHHYLVVIKGGKKGLVDTNNMPILPCRYDHITFDSERPGQVLMSVKNHVGFADLQQHIIFERPEYSVTGFPKDSLLSVQTVFPQPGVTRTYGMVTVTRRVIIPCHYEGTWTTHDSIGVSIDSMYADDGAKDGKPVRHTYVRYFSRDTYQPVSGWALWTPPASSTSMSDKPTPAKPNRFLKDGISWLVGRVVWWPEKLYAARGTIPGADAASYIAVLDSGLQYVAGPFKDSCEIIKYNPVDRLMTVQTGLEDAPSTRYGVRDLTNRTMIALQPWRLLAICRSGDSVLAVCYAEDAQLPSYYNEHPPYKLIGRDGAAVPALAGYSITAFTDRTGYHEGEPYDHFNGYLFVDSRGIVDLNGTVQLPQVSFKFDRIDPKGDGFFLLPRQRYWGGELIEMPYPGRRKPKRVKGYKLIDSTSKELFKDLPVEWVQKENPNPSLYLPWDTKSYSWKPAPPFPYLYRVSYWADGEPYNDFYMSRAGKAYIGRREE